MLLPALPLFARAIGRLVPGEGPLAAPLSPALAADPAAATDAARAVAGRIAAAAFAGLAASLRAATTPGAPARAAAGPTAAEIHRAVEDLERFLIALAPPVADEGGRRRLAALMHLTDHLHRLLHRAGQHDRIATLGTEPPLRRPARALAATLERLAAGGPDAAAAARLERLHAVVAARAARLRRSVLLREHAGMIAWAMSSPSPTRPGGSKRTLRHAERITRYALAAAKEQPGAAEAGRGAG